MEFTSFVMAEINQTADYGQDGIPIKNRKLKSCKRLG